MSRRMGKELGYALLGIPLAAVGFAYVLLTVKLTALSLTVLGLPALAAVVLGARGWGALHRNLARSALGVRVGDPAPVRRRPGLVGWVRTGLSDTTGWRAMAYLFAKLPVGVVTTGVTVAFWGYGLLFATYPVWFTVTPGSLDGQGREHPGMGIGSL